MALKVKRDFMNNQYIEGDVGNHHVLLEKYKDHLICGEDVWAGTIDGKDAVVEKGRDHFIGGEEVHGVSVNNSSGTSSAGGFGGVIALIVGILLIPVAIYLPILVWKLLYAENIPEVMVAAIGSVGLIAFIVLREPTGFFDALGIAMTGISLIFFLVAGLLSFVIRTPAMATEFSILNLLALGLVSFLVSIAPAVIIAILSAIIHKVKKE